MKDDSPFRHTQVGCETTLASGLRFRGQRGQPLHHGCAVTNKTRILK